MLNILLAFGAVLAFAFVLHALFDIKSGVSPLLALCAMVLTSVIFAMADLLKAGVLISLVAAYGSFVFAVYKNRDGIKTKAVSFFSAPVILLCASSALMLVFLAVRQPLMSSWDEFSFWGTARKLVKEHEAIYTFYSSSMLGSSIPPAMPVLSYIFQRFTPQFCEWTCFFAYDVLLFACMAAAARTAGDDWHRSVPVYITAFLTPFIFQFTARVSFIQNTYISAYSDMPMAFLFAGRVAVYLCENKGLRGLLSASLPLAVLVFVKDMGFALARIAVFIIFFDSIVCVRIPKGKFLKTAAGKLVAAAAMFLVACVSFVGWSMHLSSVSGVNRTDFGGSSQMGMAQIIISGFTQLLIGPADEKFAAVRDMMFSAFFDRKTAMAGSGFFVVCMIAAVLFAAFLSADRNGKKRRASLLATGAIGFAGYYIFHLFLYVYVFRDDAYNLASYERYMNIYYAGWFVVAVCMLAACRQKKRIFGGASLLAVCLAATALFVRYTDSGNLFVACDENYPSFRKNVMMKTDYIRPYIDKEDVIYCYSGGDDGMRWFIYTYELSDNYIVPDKYIEVYGLEQPEKMEKYQRELRKYFIEKGVTHILIDNSSAEFVENFGDLFDVPMNEIGLDSLGYYKVNYTDDGFYFTLEKGGYIADGKDF